MNLQPYLNAIILDRNDAIPIYLQISNSIAGLIQEGQVSSGSRLPGARTLAKTLGVNRLTVMAAFDELLMQGWIENQRSRGMFVSSLLPIPQQDILAEAKNRTMPATPGFPLFPFASYIPLNTSRQFPLVIDEGLPDLRLVPTDALARAYRTALRRSSKRGILAYGIGAGDETLRSLLASYINETRGIACASENVMITRGSTMGIFLAGQLLLKPDDVVIMGELSYRGARAIFDSLGVQIKTVPIDERGIKVDELDALCKQFSVRMIYLTPHHHYPTTSTLPADRRMQLTLLAAQYNFCILEDDYDYDFQYDSNPIPPIASTDREGHVVYIGSFSKSIAPALRIGFVIAPERVIEEMSKFRYIIDRQGDQLLEAAMVELFKTGEVKRHLRKSQRVYHQRRDAFCDLLDAMLAPAISYVKPSGGMAIWTQFHPDIPLHQLVMKARLQGFYLPDPEAFAPGINATRLGFTSLELQEMNIVVRKLREIIQPFQG